MKVFFSQYNSVSRLEWRVVDASRHRSTQRRSRLCFGNPARQKCNGHTVGFHFCDHISVSCFSSPCSGRLIMKWLLKHNTFGYTGLLILPPSIVDSATWAFFQGKSATGLLFLWQLQQPKRKLPSHLIERRMSTTLTWEVALHIRIYLQWSPFKTICTINVRPALLKTVGDCLHRIWTHIPYFHTYLHPVSTAAHSK